MSTDTAPTTYSENKRGLYVRRRDREVTIATSRSRVQPLATIQLRYASPEHAISTALSIQYTDPWYLVYGPGFDRQADWLAYEDARRDWKAHGLDQRLVNLAEWYTEHNLRELLRNWDVLLEVFDGKLDALENRDRFHGTVAKHFGGNLLFDAGWGKWLYGREWDERIEAIPRPPKPVQPDIGWIGSLHDDDLCGDLPPVPRDRSGIVQRAEHAATVARLFGPLALFDDISKQAFRAGKPCRQVMVTPTSKAGEWNVDTVPMHDDRIGDMYTHHRVTRADIGWMADMFGDGRRRSTPLNRDMAEWCRMLGDGGRITLEPSGPDTLVTLECAAMQTPVIFMVEHAMVPQTLTCLSDKRVRQDERYSDGVVSAYWDGDKRIGIQPTTATVKPATGRARPAAKVRQKIAEALGIRRTVVDNAFITQNPSVIMGYYDQCEQYSAQVEKIACGPSHEDGRKRGTRAEPYLLDWAKAVQRLYRAVTGKALPMEHRGQLRAIVRRRVKELNISSDCVPF